MTAFLLKGEEYAIRSDATRTLAEELMISRVGVEWKLVWSLFAGAATEPDLGVMWTELSQGQLPGVNQSMVTGLEVLTERGWERPAV